MKKLLYTALLAFGILGLSAYANAQKSTPHPAPTQEDYEKVLDFYKKMSKDALNIDWWKGKELTHRYTKKTIKFDDFSKLEKHMFMMAQGNKINLVELADFDKYWKDELLGPA